MDLPKDFKSSSRTSITTISEYSIDDLMQKIKVASPNVKVIKRNALIKTIKKDIDQSAKIITVEEVDNLYLKLQKYACADEVVKKTHIDNIKAKMS